VRSNDGFTKSEWTRLRTLASLAYERELREALDEVMAGVDGVRAGSLNVFDLSERIHEFHNGAARELWKFYNHLEPPAIVASALDRGYLKPAEVPTTLREKLPSCAL
jgi:hypothetical protein